jgi:hypothetical protein
LAQKLKSLMADKDFKQFIQKLEDDEKARLKEQTG